MKCKFTSIIASTLFVVVFVWLIAAARIPSFNGSNIYVGHSPDGQYKALLILLPTDKINQNDFSTIESITAGNVSTWGAIARASNDQIVAFYSLGNDWIGSRTGGYWQCGEMQTSPCTGYQFGNEEAQALQPNLLKRSIAWLYNRLEGIETFMDLKPNSVEEMNR